MLYLLFGVSVGVAIFVMYRCTSVGERRPRRGAARDAEFVRSIAGALRIPLSEARQMLVEAEASRRIRHLLEGHVQGEVT